MIELSDLSWLAHVAAPMLVVCADNVVAMNPAAAALFGCAENAMPEDLATLFGSATAPVTALLRSEDRQVPEPISVTRTIAGVPHGLKVAARLMTSADAGVDGIWALTITEVYKEVSSVLSDADPAQAAVPGDAWIKLLPTILDRLPVALLIEDDTDIGVFVNRGFTDIFEYRLDEIAGLDEWWVKLYPDPAARKQAERDWSEKLASAATGDGTISTSEFQVRAGGGADKMVQSHSFRIGSYRVHSYVDVSQRHQMAVDLQLLADTDPLTGILNRRSFMQSATALMRIDQPLAALLLDVDHFKLVNDRLGHAFGDQVLVEIAARCRGALRAGDVLARLGGEEFAVLLPRQDAVRAAAVAERLRSAISNTPVTGPLGEHSVTVSIGGACAKPGVSFIEELLLRADRALYAAKRAGRDCVRFDPDEAS